MNECASCDELLDFDSYMDDEDVCYRCRCEHPKLEDETYENSWELLEWLTVVGEVFALRCTDCGKVTDTEATNEIMKDKTKMEAAE